MHDLTQYFLRKWLSMLWVCRRRHVPNLVIDCGTQPRLGSQKISSAPIADLKNPKMEPYFGCSNPETPRNDHCTEHAARLLNPEDVGREFAY
jgi:hypothetical protein